MYPNLLHFPEWLPLLGGQPVTSFGLTMLLAFTAAGWVHRIQMKKMGARVGVTWDLLFMAWLALAGAKRFLVEFFRAKDDRFFGFLTLAQVISLILVLVGLAGMAKLKSGPSPSLTPSVKV